MKRRRLAIVAVALVAAGVLAYSFADLIRERIILPGAYFFWRAAQFYRAIPQPLLWAALVVVVIYLVGLTLLNPNLGGAERKKETVRRGQVEMLARSLDNRSEGIYFKWQVANLLGEIARDILDTQDRLLPGRRLHGRGWQPPGDVDNYLNAGLNTTFAEYPSPRPGARTAPAPDFDVDLDRVVKYLEAQLEADEHVHHSG